MVVSRGQKWIAVNIYIHFHRMDFDIKLDLCERGELIVVTVHDGYDCDRALPTWNLIAELLKMIPSYK